MKGNEYRFGLLLVTASAIAWSLAGYFTRLIPLDSWTMLAWRGLFGAIGIGVVMLILEGRSTLRSLLHLGWPGWLFTIISTIGMILFITSLRHTTVAHVAVIYATIPFLAAALCWLVMREQPTLSAILASLAALVGVAVMVGLGSEGNLFGNILAFGMTFAMAVMMVIARRFPDIPVMPASCMSALLSGVVCWPLGDPLAVTGQDLLFLFLFALVSSVLGLAFFMLGARYLPAIETALIGALDAPLAPLWVWLAFGETPSSSTLIGGLIVFVAVTLHVMVEARRRQRQPLLSEQF